MVSSQLPVVYTFQQCALFSVFVNIRWTCLIYCKHNLRQESHELKIVQADVTESKNV